MRKFPVNKSFSCSTGNFPTIVFISFRVKMIRTAGGYSWSDLQSV